MKFHVALALALAAAAGPLGAEPPGGAPCRPRAAEKGGVRFVELCESDVFISAAPLPCSDGQGSTGCDAVTALEASRLAGPAKNRTLDALLVDAKQAARLCAARFGGRLPTPGERAQARRRLGLVSLAVREEPGEFARLRLEELAEWVEESGHVTRSSALPPSLPGVALLRCAAEPAMARVEGVALGTVCDERPLEAGVRSPSCAVSAADSGASFELGCDPEPAALARSDPEHAALRCVLPASALAIP